MKTLRMFSTAVLLMFVLTISVPAGEIQTPPCAPGTGEIQTPPCATVEGETHTPPAAPGQVDTSPASDQEYLTEIAGSLVLTIASLF